MLRKCADVKTIRSNERLPYAGETLGVAGAGVAKM